MSDSSALFFHGTRAALAPGDEVAPAAGGVHLTPELDAAIWAAELAAGEGGPRVYVVDAAGPVVDAASQPGFARPPHPSMTWRAPGPARVLHEVTAWTHYHGTRAALRPGDLVAPGHPANFGPTPRRSNFVYFARTLDAATWGAELAAGEGHGRIYRVEPLGEYEDDPNLTNVRFRGNPSKSFRSRAPLRVLDELLGWKGHPPEAIEAMRAALARLDQQGVEPDDG